MSAVSKWLMSFLFPLSLIFIYLIFFLDASREISTQFAKFAKALK